jgi:hypothetical protein
MTPGLGGKLTSQTDQGFLGVINVKVTDVIDLELGGQGKSAFLAFASSS